MQRRRLGFPAGKASAARPARRLGLAAVAASLALSASVSASAQLLFFPSEQPPQQEPPAQAAPPVQPPAPPPPPVSPYQAARAKLNQETLIVAAGRPGTAYLAMANDLTSALSASDNVRLLAVAGDGGPATLKDALFLRGIDLAIVPGNVLAHAKATNAVGSGLANRLAYLSVLYSEEVHVVAGAGIATVGGLAGKRVAVPMDDGTAQFTAGDLFRGLGIEVDSVPLAPADALDEVRAGAVAAAVLVGGKPMGLVSALPKDGSVRLLPLPVPPGEGYLPAVLTPEDYPALIPPQAMVETVAVSAVLVTPKAGDESARRVAKHTPALLEAIARLAVSERHPKWRDVNLGALLPGWTRVDAAEAWLHKAFAKRRELLKGEAGAGAAPGGGAKAGAQSAPPRRPAAPAPQPKTVAPPPKTEIAAARDDAEVATPQRSKLFDDFEAWARKSATREPAVK
jgi:TRAP-type uncharacterized transport system substrate-binding protein